MVKKIVKKSEQVETESALAYNTEETNLIQAEKEDAVIGNPSTLLLSGVNELVSSEFGLDESYVLLAFNDGPSSAKVTLANENYKLTVEVKGTALLDLKLRLGLLD